MKPLILTYTGKHVNPLDLRPEDIDIRDIAHALACCNRFAGHCAQPISVAQHSVYVSLLCPTFPLQGLLHDASEAYLGDVTKWLKATPEFAAYCEAERRIEQQIFHHYACPLTLEPEVEAADKLMLRFEGEQAFGRARWQEWVKNLPDYPLMTLEERVGMADWMPWGWQYAKARFLERYNSLQGVF